ncbi:MAG: carbohydrate ABC transporter permease, partial [Clostridia bacterium]|nr:carbohydrate ABC transporter permease [Clostridia bacterium]
DWNTPFLYVVTNQNIIPIQLLLKRMENEVQFLAQNAHLLGAAEASAIKEAVPGETIRMCLVVLVVLPILVTYPFFQRFFIQGITVGAVKE